MAVNTSNPKLMTTGIKGNLHWQQCIVDNDGSMARDQFAAERNFLSWCKLSMCVVASGTVIYKDLYNHSAGASYGRLAQISTAYFLVLAIVLLVLSTAYLYVIKAALARENRPLKMFRPLFFQVAGSVAAVSLIFVLAIAYHRQQLDNS